MIFLPRYTNTDIYIYKHEYILCTSFTELIEMNFIYKSLSKFLIDIQMHRENLVTPKQQLVEYGPFFTFFILCTVELVLVLHTCSYYEVH